MAKIIGLMRVGRDAEQRFLPSGISVINFPVVYNYGKKDESGNRPSQWIECAWFGEFGEKMKQYINKGSVHCITLDELHIDTYPKNDGTQGHKLVGRVVDVELGPRVESTQSEKPRQQRPEASTSREQARDRQSAVSNRKPAPDFTDADDDIPF